MADYQAKVAEQQGQRENEMARQRNREKVQMMAEADAKKEALRRATEEEIQAERRRTDEHRAKLERENMRARALADAEGRIRVERENEDVHARQTKLRGEMDVKRVTEAINTTFTNLGEGFSAFISDGSKVARTIGAVALLGAGIYGTREGARVVGRYVERRLGKPTLVRETSRSAGHFAWRNRINRALGKVDEVGFSDVVLAPELDRRIASLAKSTTNTRKHAAPYRHMMFYGPPGTGKTMVAKRLAKSSGMDYAIMTGGDVGPLGRDATPELHKLFDWADTTRRGLLLFIDEGDAFLGSRARVGLSEDQRNALNALLYRTGTPTTKFMLVVATNRPSDLDAAVTDRIDEAMWFGLPDEPLREKLLRQYFDEYLRRAGEKASGGVIAGALRKRAAKISIAGDIDDAYFADLARRTEGFSGRGISKLMLSVQGAVYGQDTPVVNRDTMEEVVQMKMREFVERQRQFGGFNEDNSVIDVESTVEVTEVAEDSK